VSKPKRRRTRSAYSASKPKASVSRPAPKVRGGWLTAMLVIIAVHGVLTSVLLIAVGKEPAGVPAPVFWAAAVAVTVADMVAAVALWKWKRWGLYLYTVSTLAGIVLGMLVLPAMITAFHGILPLGILGLILSGQRKMQLLT